MLQMLANSCLNWLSRDRLSVFAFHAVPMASPDVPAELTYRQFEHLLDFIGEHLDIIPLEAAVAGLKRGRLPKHAACITFDDGYPSWFEGVIPLLKRRNLHATFYITTGQFAGLPTWHERLAQAIAALTGPAISLPMLGLGPQDISTLQERRSLYALLEGMLKYQPVDVRHELLKDLDTLAGVGSSGIDVLSVTQLRELAQAGFGVGAHTRTHPILALCDERTALTEIASVREELQALTGASIDSFAYPNGRPSMDYTPRHVHLVRAAGYTNAVTTAWGAASARTSPFEIPRFTPWGPDAGHMSLQVARNLLTRPKVIGSDSGVAPKRSVMMVENGSGFGGAVIALNTLLRATPASAASIHVVSNLPVADFSHCPAVRSSRVIHDRLINTRQLARRLELLPWPAMCKRPVYFALGRVDDLVNRLPYLIRLFHLALRLRPDIIHGNNEPASNREAMFVARLLGVPFVQHVRGAIDHLTDHDMLLNGPSSFIPVSRWLAAELLRRGVSAHRIRQIYDAVELPTHTGSHSTDAQSLRAQLGLPPSTRLVAMIGMLVPWKGQNLFLDAVACIPPDMPVAFLIIGGTPEQGDVGYADQLREQVDKLALGQRVFILGKLEGLRALLPQLDVVVSASLLPEPLGLVMLEALAEGCAFVGPAHGAATEVIHSGVDGYLFEPGCASSLADQIIHALGASEVDTQQRKQAGMKAVLQFDAARCVEATQRVYDSVLPL
jgi:glycosyltransferase involved in cell wall biosynthesis